MRVQARDTAITIDRGTLDDLEAVVALLADDAVASSRGDILSPENLPGYRAAMNRVIDGDSNEVVVARDEDGQMVGTFQLTAIPGLTRRASTRLLVEAVRVHSSSRSAGIGTAMMRWVLDVAAPALDARLVQLTSDADRVEAHRFYDRLGFDASHIGFKRSL